MGSLPRRMGTWIGYPKLVEGGEDYGYAKFFNSVDAIVMGRNMFDTVLSFGQLSYADKRVFVLSSRKLDIPAIVP